ncbi:MAG TPA: hypothetical protein VGJ05_16415, partial [Fimbriiglobus sp.]
MGRRDPGRDRKTQSATDDSLFAREFSPEKRPKEVGHILVGNPAPPILDLDPDAARFFSSSNCHFRSWAAVLQGIVEQRVEEFTKEIRLECGVNVLAGRFEPEIGRAWMAAPLEEPIRGPLRQFDRLASDASRLAFRPSQVEQ